MDEYYMKRCLDLALKGMGASAPNPMVGCLIVNGDRIIGEGYHRACGESHAEVNAIASVKDAGLLAGSTLYVNLEPCSHFGKTPPCTDLILKSGIPEIVVGTADPNSLVGGKGLKKLKENGVEVRNNVLADECRELNKRFFTFHTAKRPWILLKWAQTRDGFIDRERGKKDTQEVNWITGRQSRQLVHKWRSEEQAILVGTNTAQTDNPQLTVREWNGHNPTRIVIDRENKLPGDLNLFNNEADTLVFTSRPKADHGRVRYIEVPDGDDYISAILDHLHKFELQSLMVEGGGKLLNSFISSGLWDEARVFTGPTDFKKGVPAPKIHADPVKQLLSGKDRLDIFQNN